MLVSDTIARAAIEAIWDSTKKLIDLHTLIPKEPAFLVELSWGMQTLAIRQSNLQCMVPCPPIDLNSQHYTDCPECKMDALASYCLEQQPHHKPAAREHSRSDLHSIKSISVTRKRTLENSSIKSGRERPAQGKEAFATLCQKLQEDYEPEADEVSKLRTISLSIQTNKELKKKRLQAIRKLQKSNQERQKELMAKGKDESSYMISYDYSGSVQLTARPNAPAASAGGYAKFRYAVNTTSNREEPKVSSIQLSKIVAMTKNGTAVRSRGETDQVPDGFTESRKLPMPQGKEVEYEHEQEYRRRRVKFAGFRRGVRLPRLYQ